MKLEILKYQDHILMPGNIPRLNIAPLPGPWVGGGGRLTGVGNMDGALTNLKEKNQDFDIILHPSTRNLKDCKFST